MTNSVQKSIATKQATNETSASVLSLSPSQKEKLFRLPEGRTRLLAHDVRRLTSCAACGGMADDRMVVEGMHPKCFYKVRGKASLFALDVEERTKFYLGDIPMKIAKEWFEAAP